MRLVTFQQGASAPRIGALDTGAGQIVDFSGADANLPGDLNGLIALGSEGLRLAQAAIDNAGDDARIDAADVRLLAPIPNPLRNVLAVGRNYHEHAQEFHDSGFDATAGATAVPEFPIVFTKPNTSVVGPGDPILTSLDPTNSVDYEGELGVIIGPGGRGISKEDALDHVYGYTVINDVTARTLQHRHKQWFIGKGLDSFCPMGPVILTADEAGDVREFHLTTRVNDEPRQDAKVAALIFDVPTLIASISEGITLIPGDIIATGTPVGVGIGFEPPVFLKPGDVVSITIDPIGTLENPVE
ncbi:MAG: fumarylacetoacetate hydrolase family protein [Rhodospirillaceae bacterium]|mgnify:FL=1|jgi:2-keto-4-pentenoate hydratase/2-oxohepta-3-ene-1,7-dioic acid hydratase in catechol pathway|nr:fumarylacetoacetate hydrolase family protein [Rhodospirillaceae bacterium]MBT3887577.1 fumarylacetoacetate hydrolase family protein [Rhodospirillaceae bacterium]MBT4117984.1 fumarylacetoacetate hydrolase family protein [Rhodospirillaceae bacterium]MBT4673973.1 fumarylacetoacetate hydrolase family protein [Rhodospirillaceae bacterium]MBT4721999.1 fumarylacetoacetate hydrolase family protein [Rhodospirillaceae bacterium]